MGRVRGGRYRKQRIRAGVELANRCMMDRASEHGTPKLLTELIVRPPALLTTVVRAVRGYMGLSYCFCRLSC